METRNNDWVIERDYEVIVEALRQLIEGTCCLKDDEKIGVWDFFFKTRQALLEHIEFEEKWMLPHLPAHEREAHGYEHERLKCLLEKARRAFEAGEGDLFRLQLREFARTFKAHQLHLDSGSDCRGALEEAQAAGDVALTRMSERGHCGMIA